MLEARLRSLAAGAQATEGKRGARCRLGLEQVIMGKA